MALESVAVFPVERRDFLAALAGSGRATRAAKFCCHGTASQKHNKPLIFARLAYDILTAC